MRSSVLRSARETTAPDEQEKLAATARKIALDLEDLPRSSDLDAVRGVEGESTRNYFSTFSLMVRGDRQTFAFQGRNRRPPLDPMNALLSFLYALLVSDCAAAAQGVGLDPQVGFLHALRPGRPALALDLMEEFRPILSDRLALTLINRHQLTAADFTERPRRSSAPERCWTEKSGGGLPGTKTRRNITPGFGAKNAPGPGAPYPGPSAGSAPPGRSARLPAISLSLTHGGCLI